MSIISAKSKIEDFVKNEPKDNIEVTDKFKIMITLFLCGAFFVHEMQDFFQNMVYRHVYPELMSADLMNSYAAWQYLVWCGLGAVIAFTSDILKCKYYVECVTTGTCFIVSLTLLTLNLCVGKEGQGLVVWWLNAMLHVICYSGCPNSMSIFMDQVRHGKWSADIEILVVIAMFGHFVSLSLLSISTHFVKEFLGNAFIFLNVFVWYVLVHGLRCTILVVFKKYLYFDKSTTRPVLDLIYITYVKIRAFRFRHTEQSDYIGPAEHDVNRFWRVSGIASFYLFWGFGYIQMRTTTVKHAMYFAKGETVLLNSFAYYIYSGVALGPAIYVILKLIKKCILSPTDLKTLVVTESVLGLALLTSAIYENVIENKIGTIPNEKTAQYRILNGLDFDLQVISQFDNYTLLPYQFKTISKITAYKDGHDNSVYLVNDQSDIHERSTVSSVIGKSVFYIVKTDTGFTNLGFEPLPTSKLLGRADSLPLVYLLTTKKNSSITIVNISTGNQTFKTVSDFSLDYVRLPQKGTYDITGNVQGKELFKTYKFDADSVNQILLHGSGMKIEQLACLKALSAYGDIPTLVFYATGRYLQAIYCLRFLVYQSPPKLRTIATWFGYSMEGLAYLLFAFNLNENVIGGYLASNILFAFHVCCLTVFLYVVIKFDSYIYPE